MGFSDSNKTGDNDETVVLVCDGQSESGATCAKVEQDALSRNRLFTSTGGTLIPSKVTQWKIGNLINGSSEAMNVNGSVTPVEFTFTPSTSETWFLSKLVVQLLASSDPNSTGFAGLSALTNGVKFEYKSNGTTYNLWQGGGTTIKTNAQLSNLFMDEAIVGNTADKWFKDSGGRFYVGSICFNFGQPILKNSTSDFIKVTIQDNLSSLVSLSVGYRVWRTI